MLETLEKLAPALIGFMGTLVAGLIVSIGWIISHWLTLNREIEAKRREQRINYLLNTYRTISKIIPYDRLNEFSKINDAVQIAVADLQLFGSPEQIVMLGHLIDSYKEHRIEPGTLLQSLRDELRHELGKSKITGDLKWLSVQSDPEMVAKQHTDLINSAERRKKVGELVLNDLVTNLKDLIEVMQKPPSPEE